MKHRNTPRGGQRNEQADLLAEAEDDEYYTLDKAIAETTTVEHLLKVEILKRVWNECPLGYYQGKLLAGKNTTDADVIAWLQAMGAAVEKL